MSGLQFKKRIAVSTRGRQGLPDDLLHFYLSTLMRLTVRRILHRPSLYETFLEVLPLPANSEQNLIITDIKE